MNKNDIKLIIICCFIISILFILYFYNKKEANYANVYYKSDIILKIDLNKNDTYTVKGDNGDVVIEVLNKKIKVIKENSPYHICSKQNAISNVGESIICLPNKIIIELPNDSIDTEVK